MSSVKRPWFCSSLNILTWQLLTEGTFYSLRPEQNGCYFAEDIFKCIFSIKTYEFQINFIRICSPGFKISALVQVVAWHLFGDKPLPESMVTQFSNDHMHHPTSMRYHIETWTKWPTFCRQKYIVFLCKFHWSLFLGVKFTKIIISPGNGLAPLA